ncbi:MAG: NADP-dependent malic enzyme [Rhodanobacteraceae bacterium]|nr:NADP-dependent malic enzyme [Rhodanobacteraceae bacterium]
MSDQLKQSALEYHRQYPPGKIKVTPTKALATQRDLSLAYSPGVAAACDAIVADPNQASALTARGNLVAVISNGTAVLGLGAIGPLAAKPVMEGKGVLFQKFAGIDVFDIEIDERDPDKLVEIIASLEPTFGGINLEDIKAPECFLVERRLRERMKIPVFHDDQHGTAIIVGAAIVNALHVVGKDIGEVKLAVSGAGAAGIACLDMLVQLGMRKENILVVDRKGVVYTGRAEEMDADKARYARDTPKRTLAEVVDGADVFLGLSAGGVLKPEMVQTMAAQPIIMALANPNPEILPEHALAVRPDAIIGTGRSDYPNQVNNALCFPYIFRGALDVGATTITEPMKLACVHAIAKLAREGASDVGAAAYGGEVKSFGRDCLIPQPFDPRLLVRLAPAVAQAAMDSGVATRPILDMEAYREQLTQFIFRTGILMKPVFDAARREPKRVAFAEGEEEVMLRAVQAIVDEGFARPILIGRPAVIEQRIARMGLWIRPGEHFDITNIDSDPRFNDYWQHYHRIMERRGVNPATAKAVVRSRSTVIGALMVERGEADAMIGGTIGRFQRKLQYCQDIVGLEGGIEAPAAMSAVACDRGTFFFLDTYVHADPSANELATATIMAVERLRVFGITAKVALLSHSNFGSEDSATSRKMRQVLELLRVRAPELEVEGEMHADAALDATIRERLFPNSRLTGQANMFVFPNLDAANICFNMVRVLSGGVSLGPIVMGLKKPCYILTNSATVRRVVNMTALAVVEAQIRQRAAG